CLARRAGRRAAADTAYSGVANRVLARAGQTSLASRTGRQAVGGVEGREADATAAATRGSYVTAVRRIAGAGPDNAAAIVRTTLAAVLPGPADRSARLRAAGAGVL